MAKATATPTAKETARELKSDLENLICTLRHATRAVSDYAKDGNYTPISIERLLGNLAAEAHHLHDVYRD